VSYFNGNAYTPQELAVLSRVLDEAGQEIIVMRPMPLTSSEEHALKLWLARVIMATYSRGETDPATIKQIALQVASNQIG
jgi:hypothetical protein